MNEITLLAGIVGLIKAIKEVMPAVNGLVTLLVAVILGAIAGFYHLLNTPDVLTGIFIGVAAVGSATLASKVAGG